MRARNLEAYDRHTRPNQLEIDRQAMEAHGVEIQRTSAPPEPPRAMTSVVAQSKLAQPRSNA